MALACGAATVSCSSTHGAAPAPVRTTVTASAADGGSPSSEGDAAALGTDQWQPTDQGLVTWNFDPSAAGTTWNPTAPTNGTLFLTAVLLRRPATLHEVRYGLSGAQRAGLTKGQNLVGLYDAQGRLLATSGDQTAVWSDPADQKVDSAVFTTPYRAAAGRYYVAFLYNGVTSGLNYKASGAGTTANAGAPAGQMRYSMIPMHATTLPATVDLGRQVTPVPFNSQWIGLS